MFHTTSILVTICSPEPGGPAREELFRPQLQAYRLATPRGGTQFHLGHGEWIKILRDDGFVIDALHELYAPPDAPDHPYYALASAGWARASGRPRKSGPPTFRLTRRNRPSQSVATVSATATNIPAKTSSPA